MIYSARKSSSQQACIVSIREQSEDHQGVWMVFGKGSSRISQKRISLSDSGKCSPDRMRIDAYLHNVMSILISLMWIRLCFYFLHVTCKMLHVARLIGCDFGDEVKCVGTGQVIARCCSKLPPWMTMSMVYKASILSDFRIFQVKGMYLKILKRFRWTHHPLLTNTCRFATICCVDNWCCLETQVPIHL